MGKINSLRRCIYIFLLLLLVLSLVSPSLVHADYNELARQLESGENPDTAMIRDLSSPSTAREHWLYGRALPDPDKSFSHLENAVKKSAAGETQYFKTWIDQALVASHSNSSFFVEQLKTILDTDRKIEPGFLFTAGKYAEFLDQTDLADRCYQQILETHPGRREANLYLARLALREDDTERAGQLLEDYFLSETERRRPLYWLLKGRLFEQQNADSEAYIAYSHVINHYPESLFLAEAEQRIKPLSMPEELYPDSSAVEALTPDQSDSDDSAETSPSAREAYRVQLGSFQKRGEAESFRNRLKGELDQQLVINEAVVDGTRYYRVQAVAGESSEAAEKLQGELQERGYEGFVIHD